MPDILDNPVFQTAAMPFNLVGDALDKIPVVGPYIVPAALSLTGNPELAAAYSGIREGEKSGNPLTGLLSAGGSYAGNVIGGQLGSEAFGNTQLGNFTAPAQNVFETATSLPFGQTLGAGVGSFVGEDFGKNIGEAISGPTQQTAQNATINTFTPSRQPSLGLPESLSAMGGLSPQQQTSGIAAQGVYGQGEGPEENKYFLNLMNHRLIDDAGNVGSMDQISPIENSYLAQLGLGGATDTTDLLKKISKYQA